MATIIRYADAPLRPTYSPNPPMYYLHEPPSFRPSHTPKHSGSYPLSQLYIKYVKRAWKRVSRATRKAERASMLPDGFVLINNARLNAAARRRSVLLS